MPITPWATARMVAVHSLASGLPRSSPDTRMAMRCAAISPRSPNAMMMPETMIAAMNNRNAPPALAAAPSTVRPASLSWGIHWFSTPAMFSEAASHRACTFGPISGQAATESGGAGTLQAPLFSSVTRLSTDSPMDITTR
ncbi:hypothetical protein D3C85_1503740 [compost metagenome]